MTQEPNPFELNPQQQPPPQWGPQITPQEGQAQAGGGSFFQLSPEAMQMMWAPPGQTNLVPQPPVQVPPPQPQINPYA